MKFQLSILIIFNLLVVSCQQVKKENTTDIRNANIGVSLVILGTVQDAGSPHIACKKECCASLFEKPNPNRKVVSLGVIDHQNKKSFLFEATPDISEQVKLLKKNTSWDAHELPDGIFLTHAHIGHYTGLMYLGKEATNAKNVPTFVLPKMKSFLESNGPWSQLINGKNIRLNALENNKEIRLTDQLTVLPFKVPHRDEYSETVGYKIIGPHKSALFIPDIDKWEKWQTSIVSEIEKVDYAFVDATFFDAEEINNRDISLIPHPFVIESMDIFKNLSLEEKKKIHFIHFNHTNPLLNSNSKQSQEVLKNGFNIARIHQNFTL